MRRPLLTTTEEALRLLPHRKYENAQFLLCAGQRGFGKTWLLKSYVELTEPRVLALDVKLELDRFRYREDPNDALDELAGGGPVRRRISPPTYLEGREWVKGLLKRILDERIGDFLLLADELTRWSSIHAPEVLEALVTQGRDIGIRVAAGVQQISAVPPIMRGELTELVLFRMQYEPDIERAISWTGKTLADGREIERLLPELGVGRCFVMLGA